MRFEIDEAPRRAVVLIRRAPDRKEPLVDAVQLVDRGRAVVAARQPSEDRDEERPLARRRRPLRRNEEVLPLLERAGVARQDAGERVALAVEPQGAADGVGAAAEAPPPEIVAHDDDALAAGPAVVGVQHAAERRRNAEQAEVLAGHIAPAHALGGGAVGERHAAARIRRHLLELRLLTGQREVVHDRERKAVRRRVGEDPHQPIGILVRERPQQRRVHGAEHSGRRADAETDGEHDHQRRDRGAEHTAQADAQILCEVLDHRSP